MYILDFRCTRVFFTWI